VPYVRGRERSRLPNKIYDEIKQLILGGVKEITLLGQNVNSYGQDLGIDIDFSDLLDNICKLDGDFRIRFMTSHPKDANLKLFKTMAKNKKIARHLHLPVQAGDNGVLEAMNRGYTKEKYLSLISQARELMADLTVTSDIIVGFPGETYQQFLNTLDVVNKVEFDLLYTFIYSKRSKTPAEKMENQVPLDEKKKRLTQLMALQNPISLKKNQQLVGTRLKVLVEGFSKTNEKMLTGRTEGNKTVNFEGNKELIGSFVDLLIIKAHTWSLYGKIKNLEEV
jgi:tRNA-2-methylthio-N6-dimethylallyladenosine synthase